MIRFPPNGFRGISKVLLVFSRMGWLIEPAIRVDSDRVHLHSGLCDFFR